MVQTKDSKMSGLYRALYNACAAWMPPASKNNAIAIKAFRDHECYETYGRSYDELSAHELANLIARLNEGKSPDDYASANQLSTLKFYMFAVALVYADMKDWQYVDESTGEIYAAEDLRGFLARRFYDRKSKLPENIVRNLYNEWINKKSNQFLMEGEFKKLVRNPSVVHYERLSKKEVSYLISRYGLIYDNKINKSARPVNPQLN